MGAPLAEASSKTAQSWRVRRLLPLGGACLLLAAVAAPTLAKEFSYSAPMKGMTILDCTGKGRWARGPMDAHEIYAIDEAGQDILLYNPQAASFTSLCQAGADCNVAIDGAQYSVSRQEGDQSYSLAISRETGGWSEDQATASDRDAFIKKSGVCKPGKNPLPKGPKNKF